MDLTTLSLKLEYLKSVIEDDSITPVYLASLLNDFLQYINDSDNNISEPLASDLTALTNELSKYTQALSAETAARTSADASLLDSSKAQQQAIADLSKRINAEVQDRSDACADLYDELGEHVRDSAATIKDLDTKIYARAPIPFDGFLLSLPSLDIPAAERPFDGTYFVESAQLFYTVKSGVAQQSNDHHHHPFGAPIPFSDRFYRCGHELYYYENGSLHKYTEQLQTAVDTVADNLATESSKRQQAINTMYDSLNSLGIVPFDGIVPTVDDLAAQFITKGIYYISSAKAFCDAKYPAAWQHLSLTEHNDIDGSSARQDRIFRLGHQLYVFDGSELVSYEHAHEARLDARIDAIVGENASEAIDNFREILAFLDGVKDSESLTALLSDLAADDQKLSNRITNESNARTKAVVALNNRIDNVPILPFDAIVPNVDALSTQNSDAICYVEDYGAFSRAGRPGGWDEQGLEIYNEYDGSDYYPIPNRIYLCHDNLYVMRNGWFVPYERGLDSRIDALADVLDGEIGSVSDAIAGVADRVSAVEALADTSRPPRAFIDLWNIAAGKFGRYNPDTNLFELNGLTDLSYAEALEIYSGYLQISEGANGFIYSTLKTRTVLPWTQLRVGWVSTQLGGYCAYNQNLEAVTVSLKKVQASEIGDAFNGCRKLHTIGEVINVSAVTAESRYGRFCKGCEALVTISLEGLKCSCTFADSPLLSLDSLKFMIEHAANTTPITITVNSSVFDKITDEDKTEWHALIAIAAAKNITFAA